MAADARDLKIRILLDAVDRITRPLREMGGGATAAGKAIKKTREELTRLGKAGRELQAMKALRTEALADKTALDALRGKLDAVRKQLEGNGKAAAGLVAQEKRLTREFRAGEEALEAKNRRLDQLHHGLQRAGMGEQSLQHFEADLARRTRQANGELFKQTVRLEQLRRATARSAKMKEVGEGLRSGGIKAIAGGAVLAAPVVAAAKAAIGFEASMANVYKFQQEGARYTAQQKRDLESYLVNTGVKLGIDAEGMGAIAGQGAAGGVHDLGELKKFAADAAMLKEALNFESAEEAGSVLSGWRHAFQMDQAAAHELGETVSGLTRKWGALHGKGAEVAEIVTRVGVFGRVAGGAARSTAALGSVLSSMNVESSVAATSIKNLYGFLTRGVGASGNQKKAFSALGLEAKQVAGEMQRDAEATIQNVFTRLQALPKAQQAGVLTQLFGSRSVGALGGFLENLDRLKEAMAFVGDRKNFSHAMEEEFAGKTDNTAFRMHQAAAAWKALQIDIGTGLLPEIDRIVRKVTEVIGKVRDWASHHRKLAHAIAMGALVLGGLLVVLGAVALVVGSILGPLALFNLAFAKGAPLMAVFARGGGLLARVGPLAAGGMRLLGGGVGVLARAFLGALPAVAAFVVANLPLIAVVALVAGLALGAYLLIKHWKAVSGFFGGLWTQVRAQFGAFGQFLWGLLPDWAKIGWNLVTGLVGGIVKALPAVKKAVAGAGQSVIDWFKGKLGIHSPSRVFAQLGVHTMEGLGVGLRRGERDPLAAIVATARRATAALAIAGVGAPAAALAAPIARAALRADGLPALSAARPTPLRGRGAGAGVQPDRAGDTIIIQITPGPGHDERAIAREVERVLRERDRRAAARHDSSFSDRYEGGDV